MLTQPRTLYNDPFQARKKYIGVGSFTTHDFFRLLQKVINNEYNGGPLGRP